ncbi:hypothetical protein EFO81_13035 [Lactiplantibacillus plantarum]|uniref:P27 family phage terminase small subunit n=1 Tax=Lactiplantibacillus plantarum TaxID=1590 RepID=UPI0021A582B3|nr:P27 family phage terminase small subunit [Lactiplantibacillus plantarum]MCT3223563.1 hypothetical protein [Lactiplantibacillus plantarum]
MDHRKIRRELLAKIDKKSAVEREKVDRYISLLDVFYQLDEMITADNVMVEVKNGSQTYWKSNPAIAEKNRINTALIALEKDFKVHTATVEAPESTVKPNEKGGLV